MPPQLAYFGKRKEDSLTGGLIMAGPGLESGSAEPPSPANSGPSPIASDQIQFFRVGVGEVTDLPQAKSRFTCEWISEEENLTLQSVKDPTTGTSIFNGSFHLPYDEKAVLRLSRRRFGLPVKDLGFIPLGELFVKCASGSIHGRFPICSGSSNVENVSTGIDGASAIRGFLALVVERIDCVARPSPFVATPMVPPEAGDCPPALSQSSGGSPPSSLKTCCRRPLLTIECLTIMSFSHNGDFSEPIAIHIVAADEGFRETIGLLRLPSQSGSSGRIEILDQPWMCDEEWSGAHVTLEFRGEGTYGLLGSARIYIPLRTNETSIQAAIIQQELPEPHNIGLLQCSIMAKNRTTAASPPSISSLNEKPSSKVSKLDRMDGLSSRLSRTAGLSMEAIKRHVGFTETSNSTMDTNDADDGFVSKDSSPQLSNTRGPSSAVDPGPLSQPGSPSSQRRGPLRSVFEEYGDGLRSPNEGSAGSSRNVSRRASESHCASESHRRIESRRGSESRRGIESPLERESHRGREGRRGSESRRASQSRHGAESRRPSQSRRGAESRRPSQSRHGAESRRPSQSRHGAESCRPSQSRHGAESRRPSQSRHGAESRRPSQSRHGAESRRPSQSRRANESRRASESRLESETPQGREAPLRSEARRGSESRRRIESRRGSESRRTDHSRTDHSPPGERRRRGAITAADKSSNKLINADGFAWPVLSNTRFHEKSAWLLQYKVVCLTFCTIAWGQPEAEHGGSKGFRFGLRSHSDVSSIFITAELGETKTDSPGALTLGPCSSSKLVTGSSPTSTGSTGMTRSSPQSSSSSKGAQATTQADAPAVYNFSPPTLIKAAIANDRYLRLRFNGSRMTLGTLGTDLGGCYIDLKRFVEKMNPTGKLCRADLSCPIFAEGVTCGRVEMAVELNGDAAGSQSGSLLFNSVYENTRT